MYVLLFLFISIFSFASASDSDSQIAHYIGGEEATNLDMFSAAGITSTKPINQQFSSDDSYNLGISNKIYSFSITGSINLNSDKGLVRIILIDSNQKEYLVYEAYPLLVNDNNFRIVDFCEESCSLNGVNPSSLKIQIVDATLTLESVGYSGSMSDLDSEVQSVGVDQYNQQKKIAQDTFKSQKINSQMPTEGRRWIAGPTSISRLSYSEKKKLFYKPDGTPLDDLPNLQGFEYYKGGIFDIDPEPGASIIQSASNYPASWDYRNWHGKNVITPVKDQGSCASCWAYGALASVEALANVYYNQQLNLDISEQDSFAHSFSF